MSLLGRFGALAALACVVFLAAGCGGTELDTTKTEEQLEANLENTQGLKVDDVDCPSGIDVEPKTKFSCTVHLSGGGTKTANLEIRDKEANLDFLSLQPGK
jgi:uncharacterized protein DUF4333